MITAADTWLHLATKSVQFIQYKSNYPPVNTFGRRLSPFCLRQAAITNHSVFACTLTQSSPAYLAGGGEGTRTLNNVSALNQLFTVEHAGQTFVFLGDPSLTSTDTDLVATTFALNTQCRPYSQECHVDFGFGPATQFSCNAQWFEGVLEHPPLYPVSPSVGTYFRMMLFQDPGLKNGSDPSTIANSTNPIFPAMVAVVDSVGFDVAENGSSIPSPAIVPIGPEIVSTDSGVAFALACNSTIYDATYTWINGTFHNFTELRISNNSMAKVINAPQQSNPYFGYSYYVSGTLVSVFSNTSQEVADKMATVYSRTTLGLAAGALASAIKTAGAAHSMLTDSRRITWNAAEGSNLGRQT